MSFETRIPVRFHLCDPVGIMFYGSAFQLAHDAYEDFLEFLGVDKASWFDGKAWAVPIRHAACDYRQPLRHGDVAVVGVKIERIGTTSMTLAYSCYSEKGLHFTVTLVHTFMDTGTGQKMVVPDDFRVLLSTHGGFEVD